MAQLARSAGADAARPGLEGGGAVPGIATGLSIHAGYADCGTRRLRDVHAAVGRALWGHRLPRDEGLGISTDLPFLRIPAARDGHLRADASDQGGDQ